MNQTDLSVILVEMRSAIDSINTNFFEENASFFLNQPRYNKSDLIKFQNDYLIKNVELYTLLFDNPEELLKMLIKAHCRLSLNSFITSITMSEYDAKELFDEIDQKLNLQK